MRVDTRNLDPPALGSEDQGDRLQRAGQQAGAVADARGPIGQHGLAPNDADRLFRAGACAGARANATVQVDDGMQ